MGRSRLLYRSKHKGTLSESSRRQIREAHLKRKQVEVPNETQACSVGNSNCEDQVEIDDDVFLSNNVDLLSFPKLFIREQEYSNYLKKIQPDNDDYVCILCRNNYRTYNPLLLW